MWPFKPKPIVDADAAAWHVENFAWLARNFSGDDAFANTRLVLPKRGVFTIDSEQGHARALRIFEQVKHYCGMDDWLVDLVADDNPLAQAGMPRIDAVEAKKYALGTFGVAGNRLQISYVPALLQQPEQLIATFAHELAHYLLLRARERVVCADDETECLTDLAAVFMGFGVFLANARFNRETYSDGVWQGWRIGHSGYLPERDLIFALALFLRAKGDEADEACGSLKPHLAKLLRQAMRQLPPDHADVLTIRAAIAAAGDDSDGERRTG
jgi:hypothetical protein